MMTITEGAWTYTRTDGTFTVANTTTGQSHTTNATTMADARSFVIALLRQTRTVTYTIASGPQRARAGHQRFPHANHFE